MEYITSRCPHCQEVVKRANSITRYSEGSPVRVCPRCGKQYIDPDCHEPALIPYKPYGTIACIMTSLVHGAYSFIAVLLVVFMVGYFGNLYTVSGAHAVASAAIGCAVAVFSFFSRIKGLAAENEEKLRLWKESRARLMNPEYAKLLKQAGFKVPIEYLLDC